jgi:hypothetical protein
MIIYESRRDATHANGLKVTSQRRKFSINVASITHGFLDLCGSLPSAFAVILSSLEFNVLQLCHERQIHLKD